jgi:hypothetical protein
MDLTSRKSDQRPIVDFHGDKPAKSSNHEGIVRKMGTIQTQETRTVLQEYNTVLSRPAYGE